ncbi:MAG: prepilin-type N-terminal cleavage/methylation domain-containing protein [Candidatus Paceibacteria bacterium]
MKYLPLRPRAGFTLVEVAVALVIIGIGLTLCLQSLQTAKMQAAQTRNLKLARELGVLTLGQIESGLFQDELTSGYTESYAGEGQPDFFFEILTGEDQFEDLDPNAERSYHDAFAARRQREFEAGQESDEDEVAEVFEKVRIRISFPKFGLYKNYVDIESWMDWVQVYGEEEESDSNSSN